MILHSIFWVKDMFRAETVIKKLLNHKQLFKAGISAVVALDFSRSCYVVSQLASERLQVSMCSYVIPAASQFHRRSKSTPFQINVTPLQEIEHEEREEHAAKSIALLKHVAGRCQAKEVDFWPKAVAMAFSSDNNNDKSTAAHKTGEEIDQPRNILEDLMRPTPTRTPEKDEEFEFEFKDEDCRFSSIAASDKLPPPLRLSSTTPPPFAAAVTHQQTTTTVIYITWKEVAHHLAQSIQQTVHFVAANSADIGVVLSASKQLKLVEREAVESVDCAREWCRGWMRWPAVELQRKSSLRYKINFLGCTFPVRSLLSIQKRSSNNSSSGNVHYITD